MCMLIHARNNHKSLTKLHPLRTTDKYAKPVYLLDTPMTIKYSQVYDSLTSELTIKFK